MFSATNHRLNKDATDRLKTWFEQNADKPYPNEDVTVRLCDETGLTLKQVKTWFANTRRRLRNFDRKKPCQVRIAAPDVQTFVIRSQFAQLNGCSGSFTRDSARFPAPDYVPAPGAAGVVDLLDRYGRDRRLGDAGNWTQASVFVHEGNETDWTVDFGYSRDGAYDWSCSDYDPAKSCACGHYHQSGRRGVTRGTNRVDSCNNHPSTASGFCGSFFEQQFESIAAPVKRPQSETVARVETTTHDGANEYYHYQTAGSKPCVKRENAWDDRPRVTPSSATPRFQPTCCSYPVNPSAKLSQENISYRMHNRAVKDESGLDAVTSASTTLPSFGSVFNRASMSRRKSDGTRGIESRANWRNECYPESSSADISRIEGREKKEPIRSGSCEEPDSGSHTAPSVGTDPVKLDERLPHSMARDCTCCFCSAYQYFLSARTWPIHTTWPPSPTPLFPLQLSRHNIAPAGGHFTSYGARNETTHQPGHHNALLDYSNKNNVQNYRGDVESYANQTQNAPNENNALYLPHKSNVQNDLNRCNIQNNYDQRHCLNERNRHYYSDQTSNPPYLNFSHRSEPLNNETRDDWSREAKESCIPCYTSRKIHSASTCRGCFEENCGSCRKYNDMQNMTSCCEHNNNNGHEYITDPSQARPHQTTDKRQTARKTLEPGSKFKISLQRNDGSDNCVVTSDLQDCKRYSIDALLSSGTKPDVNDDITDGSKPNVPNYSGNQVDVDFERNPNCSYQIDGNDIHGNHGRKNVYSTKPEQFKVNSDTDINASNLCQTNVSNCNLCPDSRPNVCSSQIDISNNTNICDGKPTDDQTLCQAANANHSQNIESNDFSCRDIVSSYTNDRHVSNSAGPSDDIRRKQGNNNIGQYNDALNDTVSARENALSCTSCVENVLIDTETLADTPNDTSTPDNAPYDRSPPYNNTYCQNSPPIYNGNIKSSRSCGTRDYSEGHSGGFSDVPSYRINPKLQLYEARQNNTHNYRTRPIHDPSFAMNGNPEAVPNYGVCKWNSSGGSFGPNNAKHHEYERDYNEKTTIPNKSYCSHLSERIKTTQTHVGNQDLALRSENGNWLWNYDDGTNKQQHKGPANRFDFSTNYDHNNNVCVNTHGSGKYGGDVGTGSDEAQYDGTGDDGKLGRTGSSANSTHRAVKKNFLNYAGDVDGKLKRPVRDSTMPLCDDYTTCHRCRADTTTGEVYGTQRHEHVGCGVSDPVDADVCDKTNRALYDKTRNILDNRDRNVVDHNIVNSSGDVSVNCGAHDTGFSRRHCPRDISSNFTVDSTTTRAAISRCESNGHVDTREGITRSLDNDLGPLLKSSVESGSPGYTKQRARCTITKCSFGTRLVPRDQVTTDDIQAFVVNNDDAYINVDWNPLMTRSGFNDTRSHPSLNNETATTCDNDSVGYRESRGCNDEGLVLNRDDILSQSLVRQTDEGSKLRGDYLYVNIRKNRNGETVMTTQNYNDAKMALGKNENIPRFVKTSAERERENPQILANGLQQGISKNGGNLSIGRMELRRIEETDGEKACGLTEKSFDNVIYVKNDYVANLGRPVGEDGCKGGWKVKEDSRGEDQYRRRDGVLGEKETRDGDRVRCNGVYDGREVDRDGCNHCNGFYSDIKPPDTRGTYGARFERKPVGVESPVLSNEAGSSDGVICTLDKSGTSVSHIQPRYGVDDAANSDPLLYGTRHSNELNLALFRSSETSPEPGSLPVFDNQRGNEDETMNCPSSDDHFYTLWKKNVKSACCKPVACLRPNVRIHGYDGEIHTASLLVKSDVWTGHVETALPPVRYFVPDLQDPGLLTRHKPEEGVVYNATTIDSQGDRHFNEPVGNAEQLAPHTDEDRRHESAGCTPMDSERGLINSVVGSEKRRSSETQRDAKKSRSEPLNEFIDATPECHLVSVGVLYSASELCSTRGATDAVRVGDVTDGSRDNGVPNDTMRRRIDDGRRDTSQSMTCLKHCDTSLVSEDTVSKAVVAQALLKLYNSAGEVQGLTGANPHKYSRATVEVSENKGTRPGSSGATVMTQGGVNPVG